MGLDDTGDMGWNKMGWYRIYVMVRDNRDSFALNRLSDLRNCY